MNVLTRWDPLQEVQDFRRAMDQVMQRTYLGLDSQRTFDLPMDIYETHNSYEIEVSLPGIHPEDVDITLNSNVLTIRGEVRVDEEKDGKNYHLRERRSGSFIRSITLPSSVNEDKIVANYENGLLKLRLPKAVEAMPKHIEIKTTGSTSKMLKGQTKVR